MAHQQRHGGCRGALHQAVRADHLCAQLLHARGHVLRQLLPQPLQHVIGLLQQDLQPARDAVRVADGPDRLRPLLVPWARRGAAPALGRSWLLSGRCGLLGILGTTLAPLPALDLCGEDDVIVGTRQGLRVPLAGINHHLNVTRQRHHLPGFSSSCTALASSAFCTGTLAGGRSGGLLGSCRLGSPCRCDRRGLGWWLLPLCIQGQIYRLDLEAGALEEG
mmetsp:Transcript_18777/g.40385  ORF Transcript_18777/g.40385 Transcript_18777/m.40385 type:complete len:220 (-) Transcript_18777:1188-1847(-)